MDRHSSATKLIISSAATLAVVALAIPGVFFLVVQVFGPSLGLLITDQTDIDAMVRLFAIRDRGLIAGVVSPLFTLIAALVVWLVRKRIPVALKAVLWILCGIAALGGIVCWMLVSGFGYSG